MATAHVQTKTKQVGSGTTAAVLLTGVGGGNHLYCLNSVGGTSIATGDNLAPTSTPVATWLAGNAVLQDPGNSCNIRSEFSENVASGSWTVNGKANVAREVTTCVSESSGVATSSSKGVVNSHAQAASTTIQPGSITPTAGSILYTGVCDAGGSTTAGTINSSFVVVSDPAGGATTCWDGTNQRAGDAELPAAAASPVNPTWTIPSASAVSEIIEFLAATGGGGGGAAPPNRRRLMGVG